MTPCPARGQMPPAFPLFEREGMVAMGLANFICVGAFPDNWF